MMEENHTARCQNLAGQTVTLMAGSTAGDLGGLIFIDLGSFRTRG